MLSPQSEEVEASGHTVSPWTTELAAWAVAPPTGARSPPASGHIRRPDRRRASERRVPRRRPVGCRHARPARQEGTCACRAAVRRHGGHDRACPRWIGTRHVARPAGRLLLVLVMLLGALANAAALASSTFLAPVVTGRLSDQRPGLVLRPGRRAGRAACPCCRAGRAVVRAGKRADHAGPHRRNHPPHRDRGRPKPEALQRHIRTPVRVAPRPRTAAQAPTETSYRRTQPVPTQAHRV